jgi:hypothetical protein
VLALFGLAHAARAETPSLPVTVEREPGAEECPDTDALVARVGALVGQAGSYDGTAYRVTFTRIGQTFAAAIRSESDGATVRHLRARDPDCDGLAHATAIALAVLLDAGLAETLDDSDAKPPDVVLPPAPSPVVIVAPPRPPVKRLHVAPFVSVGGAALVGVLRPVAPALLADAGVSVERFRAALGVLWAFPQTLTLAPGEARETLVAATVRACWDVARSDSLRFDACTGAFIGVASAEARGFDVNERHNELHLSFPVEAALAARTGPIAWELGAAALVSAPPNEFRVEGRGPTYRPSPVGGLFAVRVSLEPR